jgi:hypothetical protein
MKPHVKSLMFLLAICAIVVGLAVFVRDQNLRDLQRHL